MRLTLEERILRVKTVRQYEQRTPAWYEVRRSLMTASNAAAALGIKPFDSFTGDPREDAIQNIVYRKFKGNVATRHGVKYEDYVRERFDHIMGTQTKEYGLIVHGDLHGPERGGLPWLAASPDGMTECGALVEIKCPYKRQIKPGHVPHHYMPQIQCQLLVCDLDLCFFVEWQPAHLCETGEEVFSITPVQRDPDWLDKHHDALKSFYDDLMVVRRNYVPPPPPTCLVRDDLYIDDTEPTTSIKASMFVSDDEDDGTRNLFVDDED